MKGLFLMEGARMILNKDLQREATRFMPFATWWRGDPLPDLPPLPELSVERSRDVPLIARLTKQSEQTIAALFEAGHHPYIAFIDKQPTAYGWVATQRGGIAELHFSFAVADHAIYLWNFLTLPEWRGRGIYPHLLQEIIRQEQTIERFWIGFEPGNDASEHGITKAGFEVVGDFVITPDMQHITALILFNTGTHARASAAFFNLPIVAET
jgi:GNAT superfamily N-acetyltransferase